MVVVGGGVFALLLGAHLASGSPIAVPWGVAAPLLMLAAAWVQLTVLYHVTALRALGEFTRSSVGTAVQALVGGGLGLALVWSTGVWGLLAGWLMGGLIALAVLRGGAVRVPLAPAFPREGWSLARLGFPVFGLFAASLLLRSVDRLALVRYGTAEELGHYSIGLLAAGLVTYLPESAAAVLYPRIAAAAGGSRDPERTRDEVVRAQRGLTLLLPAAVGLGMLWAGPVVAWLLPAFRDGVPALRVLAVGALMLSVGTLPGYHLVGSGQAARLLPLVALTTAAAMVLVFAVAARDPRPVPIATAAAAGYAGFSALMVAFAARDLVAGAGGRVRFALAGFAPAAWAGALALLLSARAGTAWSGALLATAVFALAYLPVAAWLGRGVGWRELIPRRDAAVART
jgi:O-antigen/teichoic acid export membrane protein